MLGTFQPNGFWVPLQIRNSEPGIASTNNALESFNNIMKKSYILNARHPLSALLDIFMLDIFMEWLVFDVSMDIKDLRKCFEMHHLPTMEVKEKSEIIDENGYVVREEENSIFTYLKHGNNVTYSVDCSNGTCTCKYFIKMGYCKHLWHAHP